MHLLYGILFLMLTIILLTAYMTLAYVLVLVVGMLWRRYRPDWIKDLKSPRNWRFGFKKKVWLFLAVVSVTICLGVYTKERAEWMSKENAHYEAKNYFISGQVVLGIRLTLTNFLHPDNPLVWPWNRLQQWIYDVGSPYLPEGDGEIGIWMDGWFVYPYSKRWLEPRSTDDSQYSPRMIALLDKAWFAIETVSMRPIADEKMKVKHYYRNFPRMLFYYCIKEGYYAGERTGSGKVLSRNPLHLDRSKKVVQWILELRKRWVENNTIQDFVREHPKVEAILLTCLIIELHDVLDGEILAGRFECDKSYVDQIVEAMNEFGAGAKGQTPAYLRMKDPKQAETLFSISIDGFIGRFAMYVLSEYCGKAFFLTKEQIIRDDHWGDMRQLFNAHFKEQLEILKEGNNVD